ncbi:MAG: hypothetical protein Q7S45_04860 [Candidatus Curtissbacteria bacterium]|nr:hypothetical protein [Candidatus Curtissbacteria bacterium]
MKVLVTREEAIIETMPFSRELVLWCKTYPDFAKALKIVYPDKFLTLGAIVTSFCSYKPKDQVIGIYAYAYTMKEPIFKQDFVINKGSLHKRFILYTRYPTASKMIKDISDFYRTYGMDNNYINTHHLTFEQLPDKVKPAGLRAVQLAEKIRKNGLLKNDPFHTKKIYEGIIRAKKTDWFTKEKL